MIIAIERKRCDTFDDAVDSKRRFPVPFFCLCRTHPPDNTLHLLAYGWFLSPRAKIHAAPPTNWNSNGITGFPLYSLSSFRPYSGSFPGGRLVCSMAAARGLKRSRPSSTLSSLTTENEQHRWSAKLLLPTISLRLKLTTDYCLPSRLRLLLFLSLLRWFWFHSFYEVSSQADLFSTITQTNIAHRRMGENMNYVSLYRIYYICFFIKIRTVARKKDNVIML